MAIPGILQQIARSNPMLQSIKQMMGMVKMAKDPQGAIEQMMMNNPQMKQVMDLIKESGGDPMKLFEAKAKEMGVDPQEILDMLK